MPASSQSRDAQQSQREFPWRFALWGAGLLVLLLPAAAMQLTSEVSWGAEDFLAAALLIGGTGLAIELAVRLFRAPLYRRAAIAAAIVSALAIWAELAVGILD